MRAILVRRLTKTHIISEQHIDLPLLLKHSTTLDPLAQTCRLFLREYQPLYLNIASPEYVLIINNFDLGQIEYAARFMYRYYDLLRRRVILPGAHPELSPFEVVARDARPFQITKAFFHLNNNNAVNSAQALLDHIKRHNELPVGLTALDNFGNLSHAGGENTFSPSSKLIYHPYAPTMTWDQVDKLFTKEQLFETREIFAELESILYSGKLATPHSRTWSAAAVYWITYVWGKPLNMDNDGWPERICPEPPTLREEIDSMMGYDLDRQSG